MLNRVRVLGQRIRGLISRRRLDEEFQQELDTHLEMLVEENLRRGLPPEEARRAARVQLGGITQLREIHREMWGLPWIETLLQDVRYGLRQLRRNPGFTAVAVLTLALGIGANTAIFSVVDTVLLRPLPYKNPGRLVWAGERFGLFLGDVVISPDFIAWKDHNRVFKQIGAFGNFTDSSGNLSGTAEPVHVKVLNVTASLFETFGVQPILGRGFRREEDQQGRDKVALLSEGLWRTRFGASREVLGKTVHLDDNPYTVVGVMPGNFSYPHADVWIPIPLNAPEFSPHSNRLVFMTVIGRLKPGINVSEAESNLTLVTHQMDRQYPPQAARMRARERVDVVSLHELLVRKERLLLLVLLGAVGFVLLVACANVANLLLSRAAARGKEFAVRVALGAGRVRLVRQLLTESFMLAAMGGLFGFLAGTWAVQLLKRLIPPSLPAEVSLDPRTFGFVTGITLLAVILFGLVPALINSRRDVNEALKAGGEHAGTGGDTHRLRSLLIVGEVALSLVLLVGAGLLVQTFVRLSEVDLGFVPRHVLTAVVQRPLTKGFNSPSEAPFFHEVLDKIHALPGVIEAGATTHTPVSKFASLIRHGFRVEGAPPFRPHQPIFATSVSPEYFRAMGIRLLKGRFFSDEDTRDAPGVVIMDETLAREAFSGRNPIGQHISRGGPKTPWQTVVGVVADTRNSALDRPPRPEIFMPYTQKPLSFMTIVVHASGDPLALAGAVRKAVQSVDQNQAISNIQTMDEVIAESAAPQRFRMVLLGLFALLALALAAIGIFGVMAYSVSRRTHEIGIRMALGAERRHVLKMVVGQGLKLALIGVGIGIAGALAVTRFLASLLYGVKPTDPLTFIAVSLMLIAVALLACYIPARRAAKVDPMVALRYE